MDRAKAIMVLTSLATGINPATGQIFSLDSPYQTVEVVRALYLAINALDNLIPKGKRRARSQLPLRAGMVWTAEEDQKLLDHFDRRIPIGSIAQLLERTDMGIEARLENKGRLLRQEPLASSVLKLQEVALLLGKPQ